MGARQLERGAQERPVAPGQRDADPGRPRIRPRIRPCPRSRPRSGPHRDHRRPRDGDPGPALDGHGQGRQGGRAPMQDPVPIPPASPGPAFRGPRLRRRDEMRDPVDVVRCGVAGRVPAPRDPGAQADRLGSLGGHQPGQAGPALQPIEPGPRPRARPALAGQLDQGRAVREAAFEPVQETQGRHAKHGAAPDETVRTALPGPDSPKLDPAPRPEERRSAMPRGAAAATVTSSPIRLNPVRFHLIFGRFLPNACPILARNYHRFGAGLSPPGWSCISPDVRKETPSIGTEVCQSCLPPTRSSVRCSN